MFDNFQVRFYVCVMSWFVVEMKDGGILDPVSVTGALWDWNFFFLVLNLSCSVTDCIV